jgi:hypothetical protein
MACLALESMEGDMGKYLIQTTTCKDDNAYGNLGKAHKYAQFQLDEKLPNKGARFTVELEKMMKMAVMLIKCMELLVCLCYIRRLVPRIRAQG